jgi:hypothetical protein
MDREALFPTRAYPLGSEPHPRLINIRKSQGLTLEIGAEINLEGAEDASSAARLYTHRRDALSSTCTFFVLAHACLSYLASGWCAPEELSWLGH